MCLTVNIFNAWQGSNIAWYGKNIIVQYGGCWVLIFSFGWPSPKCPILGKTTWPTNFGACFPVSPKQSGNIIARALFYDVSLKDLQKIWTESIEISSVQVGWPTCVCDPLLVSGQYDGDHSVWHVTTDMAKSRRQLHLKLIPSVVLSWLSHNNCALIAPVLECPHNPQSRGTSALIGAEDNSFPTQICPSLMAMKIILDMGAIYCTFERWNCSLIEEN